MIWYIGLAVAASTVAVITFAVAFVSTYKYEQLRRERRNRKRCVESIVDAWRRGEITLAEAEDILDRKENQ